MRIRKVDNNGKPLKGAIFRIYTDQDCKTLVRETNPTDDNGYTEVTMVSKIMGIKDISLKSLNIQMVVRGKSLRIRKKSFLRVFIMAR